MAGQPVRHGLTEVGHFEHRYVEHVERGNLVGIHSRTYQWLPVLTDGQVATAAPKAAINFRLAMSVAICLSPSDCYFVEQRRVIKVRKSFPLRRVDPPCRGCNRPIGYSYHRELYWPVPVGARRGAASLLRRSLIPRIGDSWPAKSGNSGLGYLAVSCPDKCCQSVKNRLWPSPSIVAAGRIWRPRDVLQYLPRHVWLLGYLRLDERGTRCSSDLVCSNNRSRTTRRIKTATTVCKRD